MKLSFSRYNQRRIIKSTAMSYARILQSEYNPDGIVDKFKTSVNIRQFCCFTMKVFYERYTRISNDFKEDHPDLDWDSVARLGTVDENASDEELIQAMRGPITEFGEFCLNLARIR